MSSSRTLLWCGALVFTGITQASDTITQRTLTEQKVTAPVEQFSVLPATCITLRQGRKCFATITIKLTLSAIGNYCLYQQGIDEPIQCWSRVATHQFSVPFESSEKVVYQLKDQQSHQIIAQAGVEVSWVHQATSRKRRWRLF